MIIYESKQNKKGGLKMGVKDLATVINHVAEDVSSLQIAIVGADRVGKTTLAKKLVDILNLTYVPEFARELLDVTKYDWTKSDDYVTHFEEAIFSCYSFVHRYLSDSGQGFVSDRTLLDITAYCLWHILKGNVLQNNQFLSFYNKLLNTLYESAYWYDIVLFYRTEGLDVTPRQNFIDATIKELMTQYWMGTAVTVMEIMRGDELRVAPNKIIKV